MDRKKVITFILFSYGFSWLIWGRQALNNNLDLGWKISKWSHILGGMGPFIGAVLTTLVFDKWEGIKHYFKEKLFTLPPFKWLVVGLGMPIIFFFVSYLFLGFFKGEWVNFAEIGINSKVPLTNTFYIWLMWCIFYGIGEEGGWRGFLFPEFCKQYKARISTLFIAIIWAPWHLPIFFYDKDFQAMGLVEVMGWIVGLVFGSLLLGWLVKQSKWSLWAVILWHGTFNLFTTGDLIDPLYPGIMSALVIIIVLWIARKYGDNYEISKNNNISSNNSKLWKT
jgi:membrane protease YdiL (CAAX protease family)